VSSQNIRSVPITKQKNTNIFQLFYCQQTQSLLITLYKYIVHTTSSRTTESVANNENCELWKIKKRILLSTREKQAVYKYCLERKEISPELKKYRQRTRILVCNNKILLNLGNLTISIGQPTPVIFNILESTLTRI
jgi:hypothetical protein